MAEEAAKSRGNSAFSSGNFTESITHFTEAIKISPNNHILYSNRSAAYASLSNFTQALSDAKKTVQIKPDWSKGYSRLGAAYAGLKNYSQAVSSYEKGLKLDPNNEALKSGLSDAESAKTKDELLKELKSAHSVEETLKVFKQMESLFDESELGFECFVVAEKIFGLGNDSEQVLVFGKRALTILTDNAKRTKFVPYLLFANVLRLLGSVCFDLRRFDECIRYLDRAVENLSKAVSDDCRLVMDCELRIQIELCNVKKVLGMMDESVVHSRRILAIKEKTLEEGCVELGRANMDVASACVNAFDPKEALLFCLKALDIYTDKLGSDSAEVAEVRGHLACIYHHMGEHDKAIELSRSAMTVLKKTSKENPGLLKLEIDCANRLIGIGKYEEAVDVLKGVISRDKEDDLQVQLFTTMASAFCYWGKFDDAEKYIGMVRRMLEEKEMNPTVVAIAFTDLSSLYEKMNNIEKAISMMKTGLSLPGIPQRLLPQFCATLVFLTFKSAMGKGDVSYMEDEVENLKVSFGPKHCVVGYGYSNLGFAYLGSGQMEPAAKSLANAKDILDVTLGPNHLTSLNISHALSVAYAALGRYHLALEIAVKVLECMKGLEPSELPFMHKVVKHVNDMKVRVAESPKMDEDLCAKISQCVISDDGKGS